MSERFSTRTVKLNSYHILLIATQIGFQGTFFDNQEAPKLHNVISTCKMLFKYKNNGMLFRQQKHSPQEAQP
tara:strand:- start:74 stop:289 length:216 start_codon:yes stop_codon:yes gene_type:complete